MSADNPATSPVRLKRSQVVTRGAIRHEARKLFVISVIVAAIWVIGTQVDSTFLKTIGNGSVYGILITIPMIVLHVLKIQKNAEEAEARDEGH